MTELEHDEKFSVHHSGNLNPLCSVDMSGHSKELDIRGRVIA